MPTIMKLWDHLKWLPADWLAALSTGAVAAAAFMLLGNTPLVRALGLALAVAGVALALQPFGRLLAAAGSLALAFSPAFWSQTGGSSQPTLDLILLGLTAAAAAAGLVAVAARRPAAGFWAGLILFVAFFWAVVGTPRSLRLTTLLTAWLLYLLTDALLIANPRPDDAAQPPLSRRHVIGLLVVFALGVFNDPLFVLLGPALALGLALCRLRLPTSYWLALALLIGIGVYGITVQYLISGWWGFSSRQAIELGIRVPYVIADGWREAARWLYLFALVAGQFTPIGVVLGVVGLARLARWYPPLGVVTMVAYAAYILFGLVYFGRDSAVLLLPLLMIQVIWMTYAVYAFGQWLQRSFRSTALIRWVAPSAFCLLPLALLLRITGVG